MIPDRKDFGTLALAAFFLIVAFFAQSARALDLKPEILKIQNLSQDRLWLRLLHLASPSTRVTSKSFYFSENSSLGVNALDELRLNLQEAQTNADYRCQFPARDEWLRVHFSELTFVAKSPCLELEKWRNSQSIDSLSIVYPNHSLESSLSVFSHTFLKFNSKKLPAGSNLNVALSFAADFNPNDSLVKLASMGTFGGYVGKFSLSNYYTEINRYGEKESRDIFEYELALSKDEINFLLHHVWEIRDAEFRYYFLNGNCSYHLLTLLEVARPDLDLSSHFHFVTVPLESLKLVLDQKHLVRSESWLPGKQTRQRQMLKNLSPQALSVYKKLLSQSQNNSLQQIESLSPQDQTTLLDLLSESLRGEPESSDLRGEALRLRSQLPPELKSQEILPPKDLPQNSHGAHALSFGAGQDQNQNGTWVQFRYRFVLHSLLDPSEGYFPNISLEVGDLRLRYSPTQDFENSSLTLANAFILKPWEEDQHRLSFQARSRFLNFLKVPKWENKVGLGISQNIFGNLDFFEMAIFDSYFDRDELKGLGLFAGSSVGFIVTQFENYKFKASLDRLIPLQSVRDGDFWESALQFAYSHSKNWSLQLGVVNSWREQSALLEGLTYF